MINKKLYNEIINKVSKVIKYQLEESLGTLQLNHEDIYEFVQIIINDIFNNKAKYISNDSLLFDIIPELNQNNNNYILLYNNPLNWIINLQVILVNNEHIKNNEGAALIDNKDLTIIKDNKLFNCVILLFNPKSQYLLESNIYHELQHYYKYLNQFINSKYQKQFNDLELSLNENYIELNFYNESIINDVKNNYNNVQYLKTLYLNLLYWLNDDELNAHIENIYGEFYLLNKRSKYFDFNKLMNDGKTSRLYCNIFQILTYLKNNKLNENILNELINDIGIKIFNVLKSYKLNNKSIISNMNFINNKLFFKCKKQIKKIEKLSKLIITYNE